jgi:hypothetical protein
MSGVLRGSKIKGHLIDLGVEGEDDIKIGFQEIGYENVNWNQVIQVCDQ